MRKSRNTAFATYTILSIMKNHPAQAYPKKIAELLGVNRSTALRHFQRLELAKFIVKTGKTFSNLYELTPEGLEVLKNSGRVLGNATKDDGLFRYHNLIFRLPIVEGKEKMTPQAVAFKRFRATDRGFLHGWECKFKDCTVFWAGSSFLVFPEQIYATDLFEALQKGLDLAERTGRKLKRLFPFLELHFRAEVCRQQMALKGGVTKWIPEHFSYVGDRLIIDFSTGEAEIETYGKFTVEGMANLASFFNDVSKGKDSEFLKSFEEIKQFVLSMKAPDKPPNFERRELM